MQHNSTPSPELEESAQPSKQSLNSIFDRDLQIPQLFTDNTQCRASLKAQNEANANSARAEWMKGSSTAATVHRPTTEKSSIKQRLRELEYFIDTKLREAQSEAAALQNQIIPEEDSSLEGIEQMKSEVLQVLENTKQDIRKQYMQQRQDGMRLNEELKLLREDTTALQYSLLALQRRMQEVEEEIGE